MAMQVKHFQGQDGMPWQKANSFTYYLFKPSLWNQACSNLVFGEVVAVCESVGARLRR